MQVIVHGAHFMDIMEVLITSTAAKPLLVVMEAVGFNYEIECYVIEEDSTFEHDQVKGPNLTTLWGWGPSPGRARTWHHP